MSDNKYTKGPWFAARDGFSIVYIKARLRGSLLQEVAACGPTERGPEQQEANANLIACAPELLDDNEELIYIIKGLIRMQPVRNLDEKIIHSENLIAKAKGESE